MASPTLGPSVTADAFGNFSTTYFIPAPICNYNLQVVDVTTCSASTVAVL